MNRACAWAWARIPLRTVALCALSLLSCKQATGHAATAADELFAVDPKDVREVDFESAKVQVIARRRPQSLDRFDVAVRVAGRSDEAHCAPRMPFEQAYRGLFSLYLEPAAIESRPSDASGITLEGAVLRIRDSIEGEPAEWRILVREEPAPCLFLVHDGGMAPLKVAPEVVRRIVYGCAAKDE